MKIIYSIIALIFMLTNASSVAAGDYFIQNSANTVTTGTGLKFYSGVQNITDTRVYQLQNFFKKYNSPLSDYASEFIFYADVYRIDWRLVPAISGVESTFGKHIPKNSYNAYGWAGGKYKFSSWEHSIEVVTKALREKYYNRGADTLAELNKIYCPPNPAWKHKVKFFMDKIESGPVFSI